MKDLESLFPNCREHQTALYQEVEHQYMVMEEVSRKMSIPVEELIEFFYKGKLKLEALKEQEEVLKNYVN